MASLIAFFWLIAGVLLQVLVFNHLHLFGGIVLIYLYALLKLPLEMNRNMQIFLGFLSGLIIDIFCNTLGMHALTAGTMMWLRYPLLHAAVSSEELKTGVPGIRKFGWMVMFRYLLSIVSFYCLLYYFIEAFTLFHFFTTLGKILMSTILTLVFAWVVEFTIHK